jgi:cathepsin H
MMATMRLSIFVFVTLSCCLLEASSSALDFDGWLELHGKQHDQSDYYSTSTAEEYQLRLGIWQANSKLVEDHNAAYHQGYTTFTMTMKSPFADLSSQEFADSYLMDPQHCSATTHTSSGKLRTNEKEEFSVPKHVDWRTKGIMTPVKSQGHCGSCWTFSTTGCLEAHTCLSKGRDCTHWKGLAEQQLVDCAGDFNNFGCSGGLPSQAFEYIKYSGGIDLEASYKYTANETGTCAASTGKVGAKVVEIFNVTSRDEGDLEYAIATLGPVSIAYQVSPDFRFYSHGVYDSFNATTNQTMCHDQPTDVNHAVVAIGLGETQDENGVPFYIIRNSWGVSWGMEGHFWMKRGENLCG